ncbi:hypothetical protein SAMN05216299_1267 [Nitrosospira sp. Nsp14]|uniref:hypothetical protein n=1 Tax=Nitrosospira sp. Nsp14 TaxID=1855333 RepID=UPI0008F2B487|nr:hypothetical protein [Nitrosospira sp. Nsp14]SFH58218.1 hypothetical protein SAMN05216299_1267 [Nitrosospira sp. Nsp14]
MPNFELLPVSIPGTPQEAEAVEKWIEACSVKGGELVCFMPTMTSNTILAVFRVNAVGALQDLKRW